MNETQLRKQVSRMKVLPRGEDRPWGNDEDHGLKHELFKQLWSSATHEDHAQWIVDKVIGMCKFCPSPAELAEIANTVSAHPNQDTRSNLEKWGPIGELCPECRPWGAFGWIKRGNRYEECSACPPSHVQSRQVQALIAVLNNPSHGQHQAVRSMFVAGNV